MQTKTEPTTVDTNTKHRRVSSDHRGKLTVWVAKFWRERIKRSDGRYPTRYHIYVDGYGLNHGSITDDKAPSTLEEADAMLAALIEAPDTEWTYGIIEEIKPVVRRGTSYKRKKGAR